jgi:hypothetical protein
MITLALSLFFFSPNDFLLLVIGRMREKNIFIFSYARGKKKRKTFWDLNTYSYTRMLLHGLIDTLGREGVDWHGRI